MLELKRICRRGELVELAERYVEECNRISTDCGAEKRRTRKFPNVAGFARSFGVGISAFKLIEEGWTDQYSAMLAVFEDEALNSEKNATVLNTYIKERLHFGEKKEGGASVPFGDVKLIFEHDIGEDGR